jgi:hypothetical protein
MIVGDPGSHNHLRVPASHQLALAPQAPKDDCRSSGARRDLGIVLVVAIPLPSWKQKTPLSGAFLDRGAEI